MKDYELLRQVRDSIIHEYRWRAYETWINPDGTFPNSPTFASDDRW
ncbi:hypothetical protein GOC94_30915 [Sinorhizobium medicae]|nr:hypothetical protein [Sinorhizobium medicae]